MFDLIILKIKYVISLSGAYSLAVKNHIEIWVEKYELFYLLFLNRFLFISVTFY